MCIVCVFQDKFKKTYDVYQTLKGTKVDFNVAQRELLKEGAVTFITPGTCEKQRKVLFLVSSWAISNIVFNG